MVWGQTRSPRKLVEKSWTAGFIRVRIYSLDGLSLSPSPLISLQAWITWAACSSIRFPPNPLTRPERRSLAQVAHTRPSLYLCAYTLLRSPPTFFTLSAHLYTSP